MTAFGHGNDVCMHSDDLTYNRHYSAHTCLTFFKLCISFSDTIFLKRLCNTTIESKYKIITRAHAQKRRQGSNYVK
jgi:hypothetical protein